MPHKKKKKKKVRDAETGEWIDINWNPPQPDSKYAKAGMHSPNSIYASSSQLTGQATNPITQNHRKLGDHTGWTRKNKLREEVHTIMNDAPAECNIIILHRSRSRGLMHHLKG